MIVKLLKRLIKCFIQQGIKYTFYKYYYHLDSFIFDYKYGVNTYKKVWLEGLNLKSENKSKGYRYVPTEPYSFKKLIRKMNFNKKDKLVDFGSGNGRVLILAALSGFQNVIGVEFSKELCEIANNNIKSLVQKNIINENQIEIIECDATKYQINEEETFFYFFHPFTIDLFKIVLYNIADSYFQNKRRIVLIYMGSNYEKIVKFSEGAKIFIEVIKYDIYGQIYHTFDTK